MESEYLGFGPQIIMFSPYLVAEVGYWRAGADSRGGGPGGQDPPPPKLHKEGKNVCVRKCHILVLNSYPDPPFPKSCIRPWRVSVNSSLSTLRCAQSQLYRKVLNVFIRIIYMYCV